MGVNIARFLILSSQFSLYAFIHGFHLKDFSRQLCSKRRMIPLGKIGARERVLLAAALFDCVGGGQGCDTPGHFKRQAACNAKNQAC